MGYDNQFNFVDVSVKNGAATLTGATRSDVGRDSAVWIANNMPGVNDVVDNIKVLPVSGFDDRIRISAVRAIYRDRCWAVMPAIRPSRSALWWTTAS